MKEDMTEKEKSYLDEDKEQKEREMRVEDFKEETCKNCHHKTLSCEENIEDCYNATELTAEQEDFMLESGIERHYERKSLNTSKTSKD